MANQFYEERIPIPRFSLDYDNQDRNVALVAQNIHVEGKNRSLLFLHIKSLNLENMRFSFSLQDNDVHANFCFIRYKYNVAHTQLTNQIVQIRETKIFDEEIIQVVWIDLLSY